MMEFPPEGDGCATQGNSLKETQWRVGPKLRLLNLHFFNICHHHPTLKFKPHATDDERYVSGIDGVPLNLKSVPGSSQLIRPYLTSYGFTDLTQCTLCIPGIDLVSCHCLSRMGFSFSTS